MKCALALDLGTTTLAGRLLAADGTVLAEARCVNPQRSLGVDVVSRLESAWRGDGPHLQVLLAEGLEGLISDLTARAGCDRSAIRAAAAAANPAITVLLCGDDPRPLLFPPYRPSSPAGRYLDLSALGVQLSAPLYLFPLVSGYIGGDLVAFVYAREPVEEGTLLVDIGTNAELALLANGQWWATSVAAGPAFEGAGIECGMLAGPGAIDGVWLEGDRLRLTVIGGGEPRGLCGSGVVAAIAAGVAAGLIDATGRIVDPAEVTTNLSRYVAVSADGNDLVLYRSAATTVRLTQGDVRAFQLAKGAVRAGVACLLERAGTTPDALSQVVMTGAMGFSLRPETIKTVALFPPGMIKNSLFVPGGAEAGVCRALLTANGFGQVESLARILSPYPLSGTPAFERAFLAALDF